MAMLLHIKIEKEGSRKGERREKQDKRKDIAEEQRKILEEHK